MSVNRLLIGLIGLFSFTLANAQIKPVRVIANENGAHLEIGGEPTLVRGMNWGYMPIGQNYSYDFFGQPDAFIEKVLHREMKLLKNLGVNAIRLFATVPPRWVEWIYDNYGIRVALNHLMGRYGFNVKGVWIGNIDYANATHRAAILEDLEKTVQQYQNTRGVLMWLLGNENNYGLHWTSFEIEPLPGEEDKTRAKPLYTMLEAGAKIIKKYDTNHPVSLTNGDLQYLDVIVEHCPSIDIFGSNVYRGANARDFYSRIWKAYKKPAMFTEFGADAFNARTGQEDALMQAEMLHAQWSDIYENTRPVGGARNAIGGFVFQWSDGWWKYKQEENLDIHDTNASWPNGGYPDFVEGQNNMNEEWFGITAKGPVDGDGHFNVYPRTAYYVLQKIWQKDPFAKPKTSFPVQEHFSTIRPDQLDPVYQTNLNTRRIKEVEKLTLNQFRVVNSMNFVKKNEAAGGDNRISFDHTESVTFGMQLRPTARSRADVAFNIVGNVAQNRINPLFYENRGQRFSVVDTEGEQQSISTLDRVRLYAGSFEIDEAAFKLEGFYRVGHYHWGDEGDFFGLYQFAHYGPNLDIYDGVAPIGAVFTGKHALNGLKVAFGPELHWGANPAVIAKYQFNLGATKLTIVHQEDVAAKRGVVTSSVIPEPRARKTTLNGEWGLGSLKLQIGGIMAGTRRLGRKYFITEDAAPGTGYFGSDVKAYENEIQLIDTLGGKARLEGSLGGVLIHLQGQYQGLVADAGAHAIPSNFTLITPGRGNHWGVESGAYMALGDIGFGPKVIYQKPLVGPIDPVDGGIDTQNGIFYPPIRLRNVLDDPFIVRDNRERLAGQFTLVYDTTPIDWFWNWDRIDRESSPFAMGLRFTYWHHPTAQDAHVAIFEGGVLAPFGTSVQARDSWRADLSWVANIGALRLFSENFIGLEDSTGESTRQVFHFGSDVGARYERWSSRAGVRFNDWGPYDYHRDFNLTFPFQLTGELSWGLRPERLGQNRTRIGVTGTYRQLDIYSERYVDPNEDELGTETEVRTFVEFAL